MATHVSPLLLIALAAGCGTSGTVDGATDASLPATESGVTSAMCARAMDLNATGMLAGDTTSIRGSTQTPVDEMPGPCNNALTGHQVYRYRVRGDQVWLRATTGVPGGTPFLDTTVWALEGACGEGARVLACNDDDYNLEGDQAGATTACRTWVRGRTCPRVRPRR
jgi:hypothetical protein